MIGVLLAFLDDQIRICATTKPKSASELFDRLGMPALIRVVARMREGKSANVLARLDPVVVKQVTTGLAGGGRLLEAPPAQNAAEARPGPRAILSHSLISC